MKRERASVKEKATARKRKSGRIRERKVREVKDERGGLQLKERRKLRENM